MKKQFLILISSIVFVALFYDQELGTNLSFFSLALLILGFIEKPTLLKDQKALILAAATIIVSISNAWLMSFTTIITSVITAFVFRYYSVDPTLKLLSQAIVYSTNWFAFIFQALQFDTWLELKKENNKNYVIKIFSYVLIPLFFIGIFFAIYVSSSDMLSNWYNRYELDVDVFIIIVLLFGFYVSFVFWNAKIYPVFKLFNTSLKNNFSVEDQKKLKPTFNEIPLELELRSGKITLVALNLMLLFFIAIFNLEHLNNTSNEIVNLSSHLHEQINMIIFSIILAILVILFFFKGIANFTLLNKSLKKLSYTWLALNAILILSAWYQNSIYVVASGLTYKRLGVYAFLILCMIGLFFSYKKIKNAQTNYFLIDKMSWVIYGSLIMISTINWSSVITYYNLTKTNTDIMYLNELKGNEKIMIKYYQTKNEEIPEEISNRVQYQKQYPFLSSNLYYKTVHLK